MRFAWLTFLIEKLAPPLVLTVLFIYTYAELWQAPYLGFNFSGSSGEIGPIFVAQHPAVLHVGDRILQVNQVSWDAYVADTRQPLFPSVAVGETLAIQVMHNGERRTISWHVQTPLVTEVLDRVVNIWWLGYIFWITGTLTALLIRPKDTRWRLLIAFYYVTACWLVIGNTSRWHLWESGILLRVLVWLSLPLYLHLHWIFPRPLGKLPPWIWPLFYMTTLGIALLQVVPLLPPTTYLYGFTMAIAGSLLLLFAHWILRPPERPTLRILLWATGFAFLPIVGISIAHLYQVLPWFGPVGLLGLVPIPAAYFYAVYRYQLGQLELRANRLIALFLFSLLTTTAVLVLTAISSSLVQFPGDVVFFSLVTVVATLIMTVVGFSPFQRFVEQRFLGIRTPLPHLLERYASRIGTRLALPDLLDLLQQEVLHTLLVKQSALIRCTAQPMWEILYYTGVMPNQVPVNNATLQQFSQRGHVYYGGNEAPNAWVRLVLPLRLENHVIGYWLLGRRDPDDFYSQSELTLFQALADQTAIALTNIEQTQTLRALYQGNVDRHEVERTHLSLALHDDVLNQMASLALAVNGSGSTDAFDRAYTIVTTRVRQLITGLRPAMLAYGLGAAIEELADDLAERAGKQLQITCDVTDDQMRLDVNIEQYLFRVVQQAAENALRHAQAKHISIIGSISKTDVQLEVRDDGIGLIIDGTLDLNSLLASKHFGLVGMYERASIVGATLQIVSHLGTGTCVTLSWPARDSESY